MASIRFGAGIVDARGSISGQTFSRNAGGAYIRARVTGTNPNTLRQQQVRQAFAQLSQGFSGLDAKTRDNWNDAARGPLGAYTNRLGEPSQYTGQQLYQSLNGIALSFGVSLDTSPEPPPLAVFPLVEITNSELTVDAGGVPQTFGLVTSVDPRDTTDPDPVRLAVDIAPGTLDAGRATSTLNFVRLAETAVITDGGQVSLASELNAFRVSIEREVGQVLWVRVTPTVPELGQTSSPIMLAVPATAAP